MSQDEISISPNVKQYAATILAEDCVGLGILKAVFAEGLAVMTMKLFVTLLCALGIASMAQAAQIVADAQISAQPDSGVFDYTLTLNNLSNSTSPIETFYFAWVGPGGHNLLPSSPTNFSSVTGWTIQIPHSGSNDGYGVLLETTTTPLNPNTSFSVSFQSPDSPTVLQAISQFDSHVNALSAWAFSGPGMIGITADISVEFVPEPSSIVLVVVGFFGLLLACPRTKCVR